MIKMTEHELCKGCKWNNYPICDGSIFDNVKMDISNLDDDFKCGQKYEDLVDDQPAFQDTQKIRIEELEARILELENK